MYVSDIRRLLSIERVLYSLFVDFIETMGLDADWSSWRRGLFLHTQMVLQRERVMNPQGGPSTGLNPIKPPSKSECISSAGRHCDGKRMQIG